MRAIFSLSLILSFVAAASPVASAALIITEVMSSSSINGSDWWELTNTGSSSVDLTNYYWDDNDNMNGADGAVFGSFSIASNQSIVILQDSDLAEFEGIWGTGITILDESQFSGGNTFSGLSSGGDIIRLYDADPSAGGTLVAGVDFVAATSGVSFEWAADGSSLGLSVAGENGAYAAGTDIGSPGVISAVPEPSSLALLSIASVGLAIRRKRRS
jgi:hypothetical protein